MKKIAVFIFILFLCYGVKAAYKCCPTDTVALCGDVCCKYECEDSGKCPNCPDGGNFGSDDATCCKDGKIWNGETYVTENSTDPICSTCTGDDCCSDEKPTGYCTYECQKSGLTYNWVKENSSCCETNEECKSADLTKPYCYYGVCSDSICGTDPSAGIVGGCCDAKRPCQYEGYTCVDNRCVAICSPENQYNGYDSSYECQCHEDGLEWCGKACADKSKDEKCCPTGVASKFYTDDFGHTYAATEGCCLTDPPNNSGGWACTSDFTWVCVYQGTDWEEYCYTN